MKGLVIKHHGEEIMMPEEKALMTVMFNCVQNRGASLHAYCADFETQTEMVWFINKQLNVGDTFTIIYTDINSASNPQIVRHDMRVLPPISKMERFKKLESICKGKGLI